jgi:hypothetical protein
MYVQCTLKKEVDTATNHTVVHDYILDAITPQALSLPAPLLS